MADGAWQEWGKPILTTIGLSLAAYFQITMVTLTVSYFINRSIYRHWGMRLFIGILAALTSIVAFWVVLFLPKAEYFGLFPIMQKANGDMFWGVTNYFRSTYDPTNTTHAEIVKELVRSSLGWRREDRGTDGVWWVNKSGVRPLEYQDRGQTPIEGIVNEDLLANARRVGAIQNLKAWETAYQGLGGTLSAAGAPPSFEAYLNAAVANANKWWGGRATRASVYDRAMDDYVERYHTDANGQETAGIRDQIETATPR
jgi:hypothetical protein